MLLGNEELHARLEAPIADRLVVTPMLDLKQIGPASIDLRLGTEFLVLRQTLEPGLDLGQLSEARFEALHERIVVPYGGSIWLHPGSFLLAATFEYLRLPADLGAYVVGRSSWGRIGLIVATAIMAHPGFKGCLTLELVNDGDSPIQLFPGAKIAQLALHTLTSKTEHPYGPRGKYEAPIVPQASRLTREAEESRRFESLQHELGARMLGKSGAEGMSPEGPSNS
jgi:dCTP deaminase